MSPTTTTTNYTTTTPRSTPHLSISTSHPVRSIYTPSTPRSSPYTPNTSSSTSSRTYTPLRTASSPAFTTPTTRRSTEPSTAGSERMEIKRRASGEGKTNVHTECGRHSDEWLFGGFSVKGVVRRVLSPK